MGFHLTCDLDAWGDCGFLILSKMNLRLLSESPPSGSQEKELSVLSSLNLSLN